MSIQHTKSITSISSYETFKVIITVHEMTYFYVSFDSIQFGYVYTVAVVVGYG